MSLARTQRRAAERKATKLARKSAGRPLDHQPNTPASIPPPRVLEPSPAQRQANRENAQHSTGPVTPEGKAAVSQNRRVHGLNYNAATFTVLPGEDQSDYDNLLAMLQLTHAPDNFTEALLVTTMAQHRWLVDRATRLQETCFDLETGQIADQKLFALYLRYQTTNERAFHKCLADILKLRSERRKEQNGFESQKRLAEQHTMTLDYQQIECDYRRIKIEREESDEMRAQWLFERQKTASQAA